MCLPCRRFLFALILFALILFTPVLSALFPFAPELFALQSLRCRSDERHVWRPACPEKGKCVRRRCSSPVRTTSARSSFCNTTVTVFRDRSTGKYSPRILGICNQSQSSWDHSDLKDPPTPPQRPVWLPAIFFSLPRLFLMNSAMRYPLLRRRTQPPAVRISILRSYYTFPPSFHVSLHY